MTALAQAILLLGQQPASPPSAIDRYSLLLVASTAVVVLISLWLLRRWTKAPQEEYFCSPAHLWRELCRAHQLSRSQIRLLKRIASRGQLSAPCELFVESAHLERAAKAGEFSRHSPQIEAIADRLFGTSQ